MDLKETARSYHAERSTRFLRRQYAWMFPSRPTAPLLALIGRKRAQFLDVTRDSVGTPTYMSILDCNGAEIARVRRNGKILPRRQPAQGVTVHVVHLAADSFPAEQFVRQVFAKP